MSAVRPPSSRTDKAASISGRSARALRKRIASNRLDFPTPFGPATHVNGPKHTSTSTRFLKPETFKRVSIVCSAACPVAQWLETLAGQSLTIAGPMIRRLYTLSCIERKTAKALVANFDQGLPPLDPSTQNSSTQHPEESTTGRNENRDRRSGRLGRSCRG